MFQQILLRGFNSYDVDAASAEVVLACLDRSLAIQSQAEEADINTIVRRFGVTGMLPQVSLPPLEGDFSDSVFDYQSAMNLIVAADRSFMGLSADVRSRFGNDAAKFVDFCSNPDNLDEMRKLGLAVPKPPDPVVVPPEA